MKKYILLFVISIGINLQNTNAQSKNPENKTLILEEFTGIKCGICPSGLELADYIKSADPSNVLLVTIHWGSLANATPDYRTIDGDKIGALPDGGLLGTPMTYINRRIFPDNPNPKNKMAVRTGSWINFANRILAEPAPVNLAVIANANPATRQLEIEVRGYYTADETEENRLTVMVLQDSLYSEQSGKDSYPERIFPQGFLHMHTLRDVITPDDTGDIITPTTKGTSFSKTYSITLPNEINNIPLDIKNLNVIAFVSHLQKNILNGAETHVTNYASLRADDLGHKLSNLMAYPNPSSGNFSTIRFANTETVDISFEIYDAVGRTISNEPPQKFHAGINEITVKTAHLVNGIYNVVLRSHSGEKQSVRLTVNR